MTKTVRAAAGTIDGRGAIGPFTSVRENPTGSEVGGSSARWDHNRDHADRGRRIARQLEKIAPMTFSFFLC